MLKIYKSMRAGTWLYRLEGELVRDNHSNFKNRIVEIYRAESAKGRRIIILDMWDVDFVDSMGLGALLDARQAVAALGGTLKLTRLSPNVKRVLDIVFKDKVFEVARAV
jgi:anti-anti-sigma factor